MQLRKAVEKARQERSAENAAGPDGSPLTGSISSTPEATRQDTAQQAHSPGAKKSQIVSIDSRRAENNRCICLQHHGEAVEKYKFLRTQVIQRTTPKGWNIIMITSALPGEGKTTTAINLSLSFAKEFDKSVLLVDCDLKQQKIHDYLGISSNKGIADYLNNRQEMSDLIVNPGIEKFSVISGGDTVTDSAELLNSPKMRSLVSEMKGRYQDRYIFLDVPPLLSSADALAFAPLVDCVIMVVEAGTTQTDDIKKAIAMVPEGKMLGLVLNEKEKCS